MIAMFLILGISIILYMLPSLISSQRGHPQRNSILVVNLFLGWTVLAWVICLAWSVSE